MLKVFSINILRPFVRFIWGLAVFSVIFLAVAVQLGRTAFPYLNDYKSIVESQLSKRLNARITIGEIAASWNGLRPSLTLNQVRVSAGSLTAAMTANKLSAQINLLAIFKDWRLALGKLDFEDLHVELVQKEDGTWMVVGLPKSSVSDNSFTIDDPLDIFLFGRRLELNNTSLTLRFRTGHVTDMIIPSASLENDSNFHRLKAKVDVDADYNALYFVLEGQGDPRDDKNFNAKGYLQLQQFPLQKVVAATGLHNTIEIEPGLWSTGSRMDLQLWFKGSPTNGITFNGGGKASGLPFRIADQAQAPAIPQFKFTGHWDKVDGLAVQMGNVGLSWPDAKIPPLNIELRAGLNAPFELRVGELDVTAWSQALSALKLNNVVADVQNKLQPGGKLRDIGITLTTAQQGYFKLHANLVGGSVESWQGTPQIRHATGFIEMTALNGRIVLDAHDGFQMHYPLVYNKPLDFFEAQGEVAWFVNLETGLIQVTSGLLTLKGEGGDGEGYVYLTLPTRATANIEPEITLVIGMQESVARYSDAYIPKTIPKALYDWLGHSIKNGELTDGGVIYRGSLLRKPLRPRSLQISVNVHNGEIAFDPAWPLLKRANASLLVDNTNVEVVIENGDLLGNRISGGRVELVNDGDAEMALAITADIQGDTESALALMRASPIQAIAGEALSRFTSTGDYTGTLEAFIPFNATKNAGWQNIHADVRGGTFAIPSLSLAFDQLDADVHFHTQQGLSVRNITAKLWQRELTGELTTQPAKSGRVLQLDFAGAAGAAELRGWLKRPILNYFSGVAPFTGTITLPFDKSAEGIDLTVHSSLEGIELSFPEPYAKDAQALMPLSMNYHLPDDGETSQIHFKSGFGIATSILMGKGALVAMDVGFGEPATAVPGKIHLHGALTTVDVSQWSRFIDQYLTALERLDTTDSDLGPVEKVAKTSSWPHPAFSMALHIDQATLGEFAIEDLALLGREQNDLWHFDLATPKIVANFQRYKDGRPAQLHFERLQLPSPDIVEPDKHKRSVLANSALQDLDALEVRIDELAIGGQGWGHIAFDFRPERNGLIARHIRGSLRGLKTTDSTLALYKRSKTEWESSFSGLVETTNIGDVLENFEYPRALVSETSAFDISLNWPGYPDEVDLNHLSGTVGLDLKNGHFIQGQNGEGGNLLRLISLLNFDTIVRRVRLDFSDLQPEGLTYDSVTGKLYFEDQTVKIKTDSPLLVNTTSADLQLFGDINLAKQTINSQLVATLPIAGNLAAAAALTAGLPAAVGVYVAGKLFKSQVDELGSVRYKVSGSWEKPKFELDKVVKDRTKRKPLSGKSSATSAR